MKRSLGRRWEKTAMIFEEEIGRNDGGGWGKNICRKGGFAIGCGKKVGGEAEGKSRDRAEGEGKKRWCGRKRWEENVSEEKQMRGIKVGQVADGMERGGGGEDGTKGCCRGREGGRGGTEGRQEVGEEVM
jgi:hypothetical protein